MKNKIASFLTFAVFVLSFCTINACKKEDGTNIITDPDTDRKMYEQAKANSGFVWFGNTDKLLPKSSGSGHIPPLMRTRYNALAASQLDAQGRVKVGAKFPEGSLVVKELYRDSTTLERYAILYKQSRNSYADDKGWVWGYLEADGVVSIPAAEKGKACTSCHLQSGHINYMLMNKFVP